MRIGGAAASLLVVVSLVVVGGSSAAPSGAAPTGVTGATSPVIIVLKNQDPSTPATPALVGARKAEVQKAQAPVLQTLAQAGAQDVHGYTVLNAISATVPSADVSALKGDPAVAEVVPNATIPLPNPTPAAATSSSATTPVAPAPGVCAPRGRVQLNPQALEAIRADSDVPGAQTARSLGITGAGVRVAFIADGIDINNPDYIRPGGQHVFFDYKDFSGQGTNAPTGGVEANIDAGSIAAQGNTVYDVSHYDALPLNRPCDIRIEGVAPGASLAGLDIFGTGGGLQSSFLQAIDYAVTVDHVNVLNESLGNNYYPDDQASIDLIKKANDEAVAAGTTVVVSSGDAGVTSTIGTPATDPNVISAGATTTYRIDLQDGYGGARFPGVSGWLDNNVSSFSSGGEEQNGQTLDLVAPGELNWVTCSKDTSIYTECVNPIGQPTNFYQSGGTSESAPLAAGTAALVIQAYRNAHGGATPSPAQVKQILTSTANDVGAPSDQQGAGLIDAYRAVLAAESYAAAPRPSGARGGSGLGATLLTGSSQLDATAPVGTPEHLSERVTNNGPTPQTVHVSTRALGPYTTIKTTTVQLSDTASPHITDWNGVNDNYEPVTFSVPGRVNRLNASIAFQNASATDPHARVRLTLIDPYGRLAAYSVPQGDGNYGNVQVTDPAPGTWRGYIYSRDSAHGGTTGPVVFGASVASYTGFGSVSPSVLHLAPGASGSVTLTTATPSHPGDAAGAIVLDSSRAGFLLGNGSRATTTVPVILRSLIPAGPTSFPGLLTGGNGRAFFIGQTDYYKLDLPAGQTALNATVTLGDNPNNPFDAWLIDPAGVAEAFSANNQLVATPAGPAAVNTQSAQLHVVSPVAGRWTLIVLFAPQVSGVALSEPFTVQMDENAPQVSASGLPRSAATQLPAGTPLTVPVTVTNKGTSPEAVFVDPRLSSSMQYNLAAVNSPDTTVPFNAAVNPAVPLYLVPSDSTSLTALAKTAGSEPIQFDAASPSGDPDIGSNQGLSVSATLSANPVTPGVWDIAPDEVGPFGSAPAPNETVNTSMLATAPKFDRAVSSDTGDLWLTSVDPTATFSTVTVNPGETKTVNVTITPSGPSGTVVSGTLYVDDAQQVLFDTAVSPNANQIAALPYEYTIK